MKVFVNGETRDVDGCHNVADLVAHLALEPRAVLIEHNSSALHRREWENIRLADGDHVEVIRVVAGG